MFFVVNKTKQHVVLGDINITLGPRQAIDLDKIMKRSKSDESQHLKIAKKRGQIEIRVKDMPEQKASSFVRSKPVVDLNKMKDEIIGEMKEVLKDQKGGVSKEDLQTMAQMLAQSLPKKETVIIRQDVENADTDEKVEMNEETLAKINSRAVDEIVKDTIVQSVQYKEEKQEDTILDNVDELEQLLE